MRPQDQHQFLCTKFPSTNTATSTSNQASQQCRTKSKRSSTSPATSSETALSSSTDAQSLVNKVRPAYPESRWVLTCRILGDFQSRRRRILGHGIHRVRCQVSAYSYQEHSVVSLMGTHLIIGRKKLGGAARVKVEGKASRNEHQEITQLICILQCM